MSAVWTKEMAEEFLETEPDSMFPCEYATACRKASKEALARMADAKKKLAVFVKQYPGQQCGTYRCYVSWSKWETHLEGQGGFSGLVMTSARRGMMTSRDEFGRCISQCANCNYRMLFNQLECVKADLESTKETLQLTSEELHSTKEALEECKAESAEEKRKFTGAIAKMVEREMGDVRTQLNALNLCLKDELGVKALSKKAASEAAKAALSASKHITLRLLMF
jgi:hypothetical protein